MENRKENWRYFVSKYPEIHKAYHAFGKALEEDGGPLEGKVCALVKIGVAVASQFDYALRSHIEKALRTGCSEEEIEHAILLTAGTAGFPRMMAALSIYREEIKGTSKKQL